MGPRCFHPRNLNPPIWAPPLTNASMGPGCFHPRNQACAFCSWETTRCFNGAGMFPSQKFEHIEVEIGSIRASMGPGCFHPRNLSGVLQFHNGTAVLQWGRDVSIPEMSG